LLFNKEEKLQYLYQAQRSFINGLLTLINCEDDGILKATNILDYLKKPEYIYFTADSFLAIADEKFYSFVEMYKEFRLPFWIQTRAETITKERAELLKEINCHRVSIGIEHGNEEFRRRVIGRKVSNKKIVEAFQLLDMVKMVQ